MDAPSSVNTDAHQHNAWLVHCQTDGVRRTVACVPTPPLACFGETVGRYFHGVKRVQPINLSEQGHSRPITELQYMGLSITLEAEYYGKQRGKKPTLHYLQKDGSIRDKQDSS